MERQSQAPPTELGGTSSGVRHEILGRLAVGGMAELYTARAVHPDGHTGHVVLKRILPHLAQDPEFIKMFRDEANLAATLVHPNIVRVHEIGHDGDDYFFTMEYVHGENCRTIIRAAQEAEAHIPLQHIVQIGLGVTEGLHYAHEHTDPQGNWLRVVHRDVSPTNIIISFGGDVKIVDFGIAKAAAASHVTQAGMLKGKASYMAPEQARAETVDRRTDVYAIGILLYELTTLTRLFRADNELAILHQILTGNFDRPSIRTPGYPLDLEAIVVKCLASSPDARYQNTIEVRDDLRRFAANNGLHPSAAGLGQYLLDLCGAKAYPWADDADADVPESETTTTGQSPSGFDEQDTKVNRALEPKTPPPRPAATTEPPTDPVGRSRSGGPRTSTDKHRPVEGRSRHVASAAARPGSAKAASTIGRPAAPGPPRPPSRPRQNSSPKIDATTRPAPSKRSRSSNVAARVAALGKAGSAPALGMPEAPPLKKPGPRGPGRTARPGPLTARQATGTPIPGPAPAPAPSGATLSGGPQPAQSHRTLPGSGSPSTQPAPSRGDPSEDAKTLVPDLARTPMSLRANSPLPSRPEVSPDRPTVHPITPPTKPDRTMMMSPEEEAKLKSTVLARTMHLDGAVGQPRGDIPKGPMRWGDSAPQAQAQPEDPLLVTQRAPNAAPPAPARTVVPSPDPSQSSSGGYPISADPRLSSSDSDALLRTQRTPLSSNPAANRLMVTQQAPLSGPNAPVPLLDEPEPRKRGFPVWLAIVIVLALAGVAAAVVMFLLPAYSPEPTPQDAGETTPTQAPPASTPTATKSEPASPDDDTAGPLAKAQPPKEPADASADGAPSEDEPPSVATREHEAPEPTPDDAPSADDVAAAEVPSTKADTTTDRPANPSRPSTTTPNTTPKKKKKAMPPEPGVPGIKPGRPVPP